MKYIRTKDGIYKDKQYQLKNVVKKDGECFVTIEEQEIIDQADTIEELCDSLVRIKDNRLPLNSNLPKVKKYRKEDSDTIIHFIRNHAKIMRDNETKEIYGAIWTDKGLIYVAKMNEKGELCLI